MKPFKPEQHLVCPFCGISFPSSDAQHFPAARTAWKKQGKADPASVSVADLTDNPESYDFED